jgi:hypothetical protein
LARQQQEQEQQKQQASSSCSVMIVTANFTDFLVAPTTAMLDFSSFFMPSSYVAAGNGTSPMQV